MNKVGRSAKIATGDLSDCLNLAHAFCAAIISASVARIFAPTKAIRLSALLDCRIGRIGAQLLPRVLLIAGEVVPSEGDPYPFQSVSVTDC